MANLFFWEILDFFLKISENEKMAKFRLNKFSPKSFSYLITVGFGFVLFKRSNGVTGATKSGSRHTIGDLEVRNPKTQNPKSSVRVQINSPEQREEEDKRIQGEDRPKEDNEHIKDEPPVERMRQKKGPMRGLAPGPPFHAGPFASRPDEQH